MAATTKHAIANNDGAKRQALLYTLWLLDEHKWDLGGRGLVSKFSNCVSGGFYIATGHSPSHSYSYPIQALPCNLRRVTS